MIFILLTTVIFMNRIYLYLGRNQLSKTAFIHAVRQIHMTWPWPLHSLEDQTQRCGSLLHHSRAVNQFHHFAASSGHILELRIQPLDLQQRRSLGDIQICTTTMIMIAALDLHYSYNCYLDMDSLLRFAHQKYLYPCLVVEVVGLAEKSSNWYSNEYSQNLNLSSIKYYLPHD